MLWVETPAGFSGTIAPAWAQVFSCLSREEAPSPGSALGGLIPHSSHRCSFIFLLQQSPIPFHPSQLFLEYLILEVLTHAGHVCSVFAVRRYGHWFANLQASFDFDRNTFYNSQFVKQRSHNKAHQSCRRLAHKFSSTQTLSTRTHSAVMQALGHRRSHRQIHR